MPVYQSSDCHFLEILGFPLAAPLVSDVYSWPRFSLGLIRLNRLGAHAILRVLNSSDPGVILHPLAGKAPRIHMLSRFVRGSCTRLPLYPLSHGCRIGGYYKAPAVVFSYTVLSIHNAVRNARVASVSILPLYALYDCELARPHGV